MPRPKIPGGSQVVQVRLGPEDRARLDRIAAAYALETGEHPTRTAAIRWAVRLLADRLDAGDAPGPLE